MLRLIKSFTLLAANVTAHLKMCKCVNNIYKSERVLLPFPSYKWSCSNMTRLLCYEVAYAFYNHNQSLLFRPKEVCNGIKYTFRFSNSNTITRHLWKNLMHSFPTISLLSKCKWFGESPLPVVPIPAEIPFGLSKASKSLQKFHRVFMIKLESVLKDAADLSSLEGLIWWTSFFKAVTSWSEAWAL